VAAHRRTVRCDADGVALPLRARFTVTIDARVWRNTWGADATEALWRAEITAAGAATFLPGGTADLTCTTRLTDAGITAGASAGHSKWTIGIAWIRVEVIVRIGPLLTLLPIFLLAATTFAAPTIFPGFGMIHTEQWGQGAKSKP
jgi:hypothetical protein